MARWSVENGDAEMIIEVTPDGRVSLEVQPPGAFVADTDTAQDVRIKIGAAIGVAHHVAHRSETKPPRAPIT